mgnify:CR=1 FL=1
MIAAALASVSLVMPGPGSADVLISRTGSVVAERGEDGISVHGGRNTSFRTRSWRRYWGWDPYQASAELKADGASSARRYSLEAGQYLFRIKNLSAVRPACSSGAIVILPRKYARYCKGAQLIIEQELLEKYGPAGIWDAKTDQPTLMWTNPPNS